MKLKRMLENQQTNHPAAFRRLCVETGRDVLRAWKLRPAAFRRLCVETSWKNGCVPMSHDQPPSGGCVLKLGKYEITFELVNQPPSGGCVLKHSVIHRRCFWPIPAAFRRLCVETRLKLNRRNPYGVPAAFRRLCVETTSHKKSAAALEIQPPSGGCVLKLPPKSNIQRKKEPSRLQAAVC